VKTLGLCCGEEVEACSHSLIYVESDAYGEDFDIGTIETLEICC
jgi:hypothetical protein